MDIQTTQTLYILPLQDRCYERPKITLNHHDTNVRQMYFSASDAQIFFQIVCSKVHTLLFFSIRKLIHWIVTKKLFDNFIMLVILVGKGSATYFIQIKIFIVLFSLSPPRIQLSVHPSVPIYYICVRFNCVRCNCVQCIRIQSMCPMVGELLVICVGHAA